MLRYTTLSSVRSTHHVVHCFAHTIWLPQSMDHSWWTHLNRTHQSVCWADPVTWTQSLDTLIQTTAKLCFIFWHYATYQIEVYEVQSQLADARVYLLDLHTAGSHVTWQGREHRTDKVGYVVGDVITTRCSNCQNNTCSQTTLNFVHTNICTNSDQLTS
jgi:hypothetical protein